MAKSVKVELTQGYYTIIDAADAKEVNKHLWSAAKVRKNRVVAQNAKLGYLHRWLMNAPPGTEVDHKNHDLLDNRRQNLRLADSSQNKANRRKMSRKGKSIYKGVAPRNNKVSKWRALICKDKKTKTLGSFKTQLEAALAYDAEAAKLFGEFAKLNFPERYKIALKTVYPPTRKRRSLNPPSKSR